MKRLLSAFIVMAVATVCVTAQPNLVPNGNFETYTNCPNAFSQVGNATGWLSWNTSGSPDYFNTCATTGPTIPTSVVGYQWPASGNGYMGIFNSSVPNIVKEYITRPIPALQVGMIYEISMSVSLANFSAGGTNDLAVYFYDAGPTSYTGLGIAPVTPKVNWSTMAITDTQSWVRLSKTFIADSAYDNIAIGGFLGTSTVNFVPVTGNSGITYYLIDSVVLKVFDSLSFVFTDSLKCSGDTIKVNYISSKKKQSTNTFTLQLSNSSGSFASPVNIGSLSSDTSGMITGVIPANTPTGTGYRLRIVASNFADTSEPGINIKIGNGPVGKPIANNNGPVCANDTLKLSASTTTPGVTWAWTGPNIFNSSLQNPQIFTPLPVNSGNYIVTARLHGCVAKDTTTVVVNAGTGPSGTTASYNTPLCADDTLKLFGTANGTGNSYNWIGPNSFSSGTQNPVLPSATTAMSGDYVLYAGNGNCVSRDTVTVVVKPRPANFGATTNAPICTGETLTFTASSTSTGVTYAWAGPNGFNSTSATPFINGATAIQNGDYYVTGTLNGCPLSDTVSVTVKPLPAKPVANVNTPVCAGETLNFTASTSTTGVTWSWSGPVSYSSTAQNPSVTNTTTAMSGDYIVAAILNGCSLTDTATVLVKPLPAAVTLSNNGPVCAGDTLNLSSTASTTGVNYSWVGPNSFSANTQNTFVANSTTAASGWYVATLNLNGCFFKDSTQATVHPIPATPSVSYSNPMCVGETLQLNASTVPGATYSWTGVGNYSSTQQNPIRGNMQFGDTGTYSVTASANGCTSPAGSIKVNINPVPFVVIFPTPGDSICVGEQVSFTALPNNHGGTPTYQWRINGVLAGSTATTYSSTTLNHSDVVRVDMTENTKCRMPYVDASNDVEMKVLPWLAPSVTISANPNRPLNVDEYVTFTATPVNGGNNPKYQWKRNGQDVQGATGPVWSANTLNDNDSISVELISNYRCPQPPTASSNGIRVKVLTGVGDVNIVKGLMLYPNPNSGKFALTGEVVAEETLHIEIINALGQVMYRDEITADNSQLHKEIDMQEVPAGVYMLRITGQGGGTLLRFYVQ